VAWANTPTGSPYTLPCSQVKTRHGKADGTNLAGGGSNISYADGHVKFATASYFYYKLGIVPAAPQPSDPGFWEGARDAICVGGPTVP